MGRDMVSAKKYDLMYLHNQTGKNTRHEVYTISGDAGCILS